MNRLEQDARPILEQLASASANGMTYALTFEECRILTRQVVLISWCLEVDVDVEGMGGTRTTLERRSRLIRESEPPANSAVWVARCPDPYVRQWLHVAAIDPVDNVSSPLASNVVLAVLTFAGLAFYVTTADVALLQPLPAAGVWARIWPAPTDARLPAETISSQELGASVGAFARARNVPVLATEAA
jgi:hypothetical protein